MGDCGDPQGNRTENEGSQALGLIWEVALVLISKTEFVWSRTGGVLGRQVCPQVGLAPVCIGSGLGGVDGPHSGCTMVQG